LLTALAFPRGVTTGRSSKRLRVVNSCSSEPLWVAHEAGGSSGPDEQNVQVPSGQSVVFTTSNGLADTRYWAKMRCDANGHECLLGGSGGPGQVCVRETETGLADYSHCAPFVDSKFEASFGITGLPCLPSEGLSQGCDYIFSGAMSGYTLPFRLDFSGSCTRQDGSSLERIDCADLDMALCPVSEKDLRLAGVDGSLRFQDKTNAALVGCYSPCQRLAEASALPGNTSAAAAATAARLCCPGSASACMAGAARESSYGKAVLDMCDGLDSSLGNTPIRCAASTHYTLTFFCPRPSLPSQQEVPGSAMSAMGDDQPSSDRHWFLIAVLVSSLIVIAAVSVVMQQRRERRPSYNRVPRSQSGQHLLEAESATSHGFDTAARGSSDGEDYDEPQKVEKTSFLWAMTTC